MVITMKACDKFHKPRAPKKVMLDKSYAGVKAGQMLFVGTPQILADYIAAIPHGETACIVKLRNQLARKHKCDAMCPTSTAIFLRIIAEYALEELAQGKPVSQVVPFWRVIAPDDKIAKRLSVDTGWIADRRAFEVQTDA